jgi:hypothetical protein
MTFAIMSQESTCSLDDVSICELAHTSIAFAYLPKSMHNSSHQTKVLPATFRDNQLIHLSRALPRFNSLVLACLLQLPCLLVESLPWL